MLKHIFLLFTFIFLMVSCDNKHTEPNVELIQDMMYTPAMKAQRPDPTSETGAGMRVPPDGTIPRGFVPYEYKGKADLAEKNLVNPVSGPDSIARGKVLFETYCYVCHGVNADGKGRVAAKFAVPVPSLLTDKVKKYRDGRIFHIMTDGQGMMSSYLKQIHSSKDRWSIVNYIRTLQKAGG